MIEIGLICLLPEEPSNYYQELRQKIAAGFGLPVIPNVPAHITVTYPFPVKSTNRIEKVAEDFCMSEIRTKWTLYDFGHFINPDKYVVFIDALPTKETRKVHARLLNRLRKISREQWEPFDIAKWRYHVTLATHGITSENFEAVWSFVNRQEKPNFEAFFDNLALVQKDGDNRFVYKTYRFPSQKAG